MNDKRSLLLLLCAALILTWGYHLYDKSYYSSTTKEIYIRDSSGVAAAVSDSLKKIFTQKLDELSFEKLTIGPASTMLKDESDQQIAEINVLKNEIDLILKRKNLTQSDLNEVNSKIRDLQDKIKFIKHENTLVTEDRKQLIDNLAQLNSRMNSLQQSFQKVNSRKTELPGKINALPLLTASAIKFSTVHLQPDQKEIETKHVKNADKFVASFFVQNKIADIQNAEVIIVVTGPDGRTLNTEVWDAGSFETKTEGRKSFTRKMKFDYNKAEAKKFLFTIQPDVFEKGTYRFSLYHNGIKIGEANWALN
jgi:TolA-binding protein